MAQASPEFLNLITSCQIPLKAYIYASIGNLADTEDILQKTNTVMLSKPQDFGGKDEFMAWAVTVARYELLGFIRDRQRDRLVFSPELVEAMSSISSSRLEELSDRQEALRLCLSQLPATRLKILKYRYGSEMTIEQMSQRVGKTVDAVKSMLLRVRRMLRKCITMRLHEMTHTH